MYLPWGRWISLVIHCYLFYHFAHLILGFFPSLVILWQVPPKFLKTFSCYQFIHLTGGCAQDPEFHFSSSLSLPLGDVENRGFMLCSESDWLFNMFCETTCTAKGHPWSVSESQHLYRVLNPVMTVCEIHYQPDLQHRSQLTCAAGVWSTGHGTVRRMGDWYYTIWMSPGLQNNHLSAHCLWVFVALFICCHPKCLDVNESSPLEVSRLCFSERENQTPDCSCQVEGKLCLIEGAASTEQKNSSCVLRLTPSMEPWD